MKKANEIDDINKRIDNKPIEMEEPQKINSAESKQIGRKRFLRGAVALAAGALAVGSYGLFNYLVDNAKNNPNEPNNPIANIAENESSDPNRGVYDTDKRVNFINFDLGMASGVTQGEIIENTQKIKSCYNPENLKIYTLFGIADYKEVSDLENIVNKGHFVGETKFIETLRLLKNRMNKRISDGGYEDVIFRAQIEHIDDSEKLYVRIQQSSDYVHKLDELNSDMVKLKGAMLQQSSKGYKFYSKEIREMELDLRENIDRIIKEMGFDGYKTIKAVPFP